MAKLEARVNEAELLKCLDTERHSADSTKTLAAEIEAKAVAPAGERAMQLERAQVASVATRVEQSRQEHRIISWLTCQGAETAVELAQCAVSWLVDIVGQLPAAVELPVSLEMLSHRRMQTLLPPGNESLVFAGNIIDTNPSESSGLGIVQQDVTTEAMQEGCLSIEVRTGIKVYADLAFVFEARNSWSCMIQTYLVCGSTGAVRRD